MNITKKRYNSTLLFIFLAMILICCDDISIYDESIVIESQIDTNEIITTPPSGPQGEPGGKSYPLQLEASTGMSRACSALPAAHAPRSGIPKSPARANWRDSRRMAMPFGRPTLRGGKRPPTLAGGARPSTITTAGQLWPRP